MSDMDDEEYGSDGYSEDESDAESHAFETPPIQAAELAFRVLLPEECLSNAQKQVQEVQELLCCDAQVACLLLRHFKWDRDKLTDGASAFLEGPFSTSSKHNRTQSPMQVCSLVPFLPHSIYG